MSTEESGSSTLKENGEFDAERALSRTSYRGLWSHLIAEVDPDKATAPLAVFSFMTGFIDSISFTAIFVWCGFQTGNFVQLSLAIARLFAGALGNRDTTFHLPDQQALTSLITFNLGASLGRFGDRLGALTRRWLILGTFVQALFTMAASIAIWKSGQASIASSRDNPAWTNVLSFVCVAFASASLGLQGVMGKRLNTPFSTTLVLTTIWCELVADPRLFNLRWIKSRDHRLAGAFFIFLGGFVGRTLVDQIGAAGALGVGAGVRLLVGFSWLFVPRKPIKS